MKNSADLGGCYPPWPSTSVDNTLLDLHNSSYASQPHSIKIIANYGTYPHKMKSTSQSNIDQLHIFRGLGGKVMTNNLWL